MRAATLRRERKLFSNNNGLESYDVWRHQQEHPQLAGVAAGEEVRFSVFIEAIATTTNAEIERTKGSIFGQPEVGADVTVVRQGELVDLSTAPGDFVVFLRAGARFAPLALADIAKKHRVDPAVKVITFDSDVKIAGKAESPMFRPVWSPEMMLSANYLDRAFAVKRVVAEGLPPVELSDRGVWRFLLDLDLRPRETANVSRVLLSEPRDWRANASDADAQMVREVLASRGENSSASVENGVVRVMFDLPEWPTVSVVIPTRHSRKNLARLLPSLARTDYDAFDVTIIDNGGQSDENDEWYEQNTRGLSASIIWWTEQPFNYSRVNNVAARASSGEVVLLLNDDTEIVDPQWMKEMVGHLMRDGVGTVGVQHRQADGLIQHGGVTIGPGGSADNLFAGMTPGADTIIGSTKWYRNGLAVTGACVAIRRSDFEEVGGLAENFILCGSDVVLGLDQIIRSRRNVVIPFDTVRHFESLTRGTAVPVEDYYSSYWRYHSWLLGGNPYLSPNVSPLTAVPRFNSVWDDSPLKLALSNMNRAYTKVVQSGSISEEAKVLLGAATISAEEVRAVHTAHEALIGRSDVKTVNWFIPDIDMPFFGGLNTAFRIADKLARDHGVTNRFISLATPDLPFTTSALTAAFPSLSEAEIVFYDGSDESIASLPAADAAVATLWLTAVHVAKAPNVGRKFYLMQDYEPGFYPASSLYAMAEETYKLGLYALCNTESMHKIYTEMYHGKGMAFTPAVDSTIYHAEGRREKSAGEPVTIFAYARDHFRNCWELVYAALAEIKRIHGDGVRIVAAGARYLPESADFIDMRLLDYRATGAIYRETDIGLTMQISRHPSYLPLELMASGVAMVAPDSDWFKWLFKDGENSVLTMRTLDDIVEKLDLLVRDKALRSRIQSNALDTIQANHSQWDTALGGIYDYLSDPEKIS
ncbi:Glycosyltransferase, GT2 family [Agreia pratensis]|uniref:Glycosyltransferase, GT2 family n=1 Tax=Agreia pratensis TaxID=150121 RepID=A0A1X7ICI3_9MICO|nr:Glycosyltransferase, GT2 family [Agreia pratensis]